MMNLLSIIIFAVISFVISACTSIFTMLAIGEDAKALGIKKRTGYMVLGFIIPFVGAIVYLCTRKNAKKIQPKMCNICQSTVDNAVSICPVCGCSTFTDYLIKDRESHIKKAKIFMIIAICCYVATSCISIVTTNFKDEIDKIENYSYNQDDGDNDKENDFKNFSFDDDFFNNFNGE